MTKAILNLQELINRYPIIIISAVVGLYIGMAVLNQRVLAIEAEQIIDKKLNDVVIGLVEKVEMINQRTQRIESKLDRHIEANP